MSEYDKTDKGKAFKPFYNQMILEGPINDNGNDTRIAVIQSKDKEGKVFRDLYVKVGTLFPNEAADESNENFNPKAPAYTGPFGDRRCSVWRDIDKYDNACMSFKLQDKYNDGAPAAAAAPAANDTGPSPEELADAIPF